MAGLHIFKGRVEDSGSEVKVRVRVSVMVRVKVIHDENKLTRVHVCVQHRANVLPELVQAAPQAGSRR